MNGGDRRTLSNSAAFAQIGLFLFAAKSLIVAWSMESRGIFAEHAEFLNVASWTNVKSREKYIVTHIDKTFAGLTLLS